MKVTGQLDMVRDFGFLRRTEVGDVYVAPAQIQAFGLRHGDEVTGTAAVNHGKDGHCLTHIEGRKSLDNGGNREAIERLLLAALVDYAWPEDAEPTVREARKLAAALAKVVAP